ncbi:glutamine amidotransferase-like class 1 domain-containing protein 1 [Aplysia californica]|uniref:Glutamine amidotransferase-like class 1 domain-containing protein 1 n=1 Tax=Aplysia californica TaxID=6500 RepID=A0ABM0JDA4_APLCA|nr:glutamine amidotransferase-like class 1 domain-containing protein 1 [Aplysia californica]
MATSRGSCLVVISSAVEGVSAASFMQACTLINQTFAIQLASPGGRQAEYVNQDDSNRRWFNEFRSKASSTPIGLETVDVNRYSAMLIPACPGAIHDLAGNKDLSQILVHFIKEKKPICAIGQGVAGLCPARREDGKSWYLEDFCLTSPSLFEVGHLPEFLTMPIILEDFIKDHGGKYTATEPDGVHVVIDRFLITGQNTQSTVTAVQNLILMCSQKQSRPGSLSRYPSQQP